MPNRQQHKSMLFEDLADGHKSKNQQQNSTSMALSQLLTRFNNFPPTLPPKTTTGFGQPLQMHVQFSSTLDSKIQTRKTMKSNSIPISAETPSLWNCAQNNRNYVGRRSDSGLVAFTQTYPAQKRKFVENCAVNNPVMQLLQQTQQTQSPQSYASSTASSPSSASSSDEASSIYFDPFYLEYRNDEDESALTSEGEGCSRRSSSADSFCSLPDR